MPDAAAVFKGRGEIARSRIPSGPRWDVGYRVAVSSAGFTGPMMFY
jgi:hypothetical protein